MRCQPVVGVGDHAVAVEDAADVLLRPVAVGFLLPQQAPRRCCHSLQAADLASILKALPYGICMLLQV